MPHPCRIPKPWIIRISVTRAQPKENPPSTPGPYSPSAPPRPTRNSPLPPSQKFQILPLRISLAFADEGNITSAPSIAQTATCTTLHAMAARNLPDYFANRRVIWSWYRLTPVGRSFNASLSSGEGVCISKGRNSCCKGRLPGPSLRLRRPRTPTNETPEYGTETPNIA